MRNLKLAGSLLFIACSSQPQSTNDMGQSDIKIFGQDLARANAMAFRYVTNQILLPKNQAQYNADLDGNGKSENALGGMVGLLSSQNIDLQKEEDLLISHGDGLQLFSFMTTDTGLTTDAEAHVTLYAAKQQDPPDFSGKGGFTVDPVVKSSVLVGSLASGSFQSQDPKKLSEPPTVYIKVPLYDDTRVTLPLRGARSAFTPLADQVKAGQINGVVRRSDLEEILIPALAITFTKVAQTEPCTQGSNCAFVRKSFDTGDCTNPNQSMAKAGDNVVDVCEVSQNALVMLLLTPDLQMFDSKGNWKPVPDGKERDSLSFGVAFKAVNAKFSE